MVNKIYQLQYDDEFDKDIHEYIENLPRNRKAEMVRHAIRYYLNYHGKELVPVLTPPVEVVKENNKEKKRPALGIGGIL
jgi:hypothetical protein